MGAQEVQEEVAMQVQLATITTLATSVAVKWAYTPQQAPLWATLLTNSDTIEANFH